MCFRLLFSVLIFQVVFTSSEGLVPHMLTRRSSKSRMGKIIEIGDPTVEHATQYLTCRGVPENISSVLNITGTRFKELDATATALLAGDSLDDASCEICSGTWRQSCRGWVFHRAPPATSDPMDKSFWTIVDAIVRNGVMTTKAFHDAVSTQGTQRYPQLLQHLSDGQSERTGNLSVETR